MTDLTRLLAHEMAARLHSGEVSSRELTLAHLDLAERQDHGLHAWLTVDGQPGVKAVVLCLGEVEVRFGQLARGHLAREEAGGHVVRVQARQLGRHRVVRRAAGVSRARRGSPAPR